MAEPLQDVWIDFNCRVPMRDGVQLAADVYRPTGDGTYPVILRRTPYLRTNPAAVDAMRYFVERGYVYVCMDVRGRGDSDGDFVPYRCEGVDGYDAIEWAATQAWSNGAVGTIGGSYEARIQWLTALETPPHLRAMVAVVSPSDPFVESPTGTPSPMHLCWHTMTSGRGMQNVHIIDWMTVYKHLPLQTMDERVGRTIARWREEVLHDRLDEYWRALCYQDKFSQVDLPVLHISGWYDDEQIGTPLNFAGMVRGAASERSRKNQRLLMGPWTHQVNTASKVGEIDFGPSAIIDMNAYLLAWWDHTLRGNDVSVADDYPVRIFIMGRNEWRDEREWPPARAQEKLLYLRSGGRANSRFGDGSLRFETPDDEPPDSYTSDPANPVPFITEPLSNQIGGPDDYAAVQRRDDVLVYTTSPLDAEIEVTGPVRAVLYASSSAPDTDFMVMLLDVHPNGFAQRLCDGMVRARFRAGMDCPTPIEPGRVECYAIDLWNTAQLFRRGHRIQVQVTSSAFPKYDRNLNTGAPLGTTTECAAATQQIYHDMDHASHVILPIIPAL
ncbi:MAG: CocE/NonD family hydrolase [Chloroflexota bacterium]